jgi:hypothetical protein
VLRCLVSMKDVKANPDKITTILHMQPPQTRKEVQKLTSHITFLNRFIAKMEERNLPFFIVLRGSTIVEWDSEQEKAFEDLKLYIQQLPMLSSLEPGQPLILYVSATHSVVSGALVVEK